MAFYGYTLSGMDEKFHTSFFAQKKGHLMPSRYTMNSPQTT